jgi:hypothetical protein
MTTKKPSTKIPRGGAKTRLAQAKRSRDDIDDEEGTNERHIQSKLTKTCRSETDSHGSGSSDEERADSQIGRELSLINTGRNKVVGDSQSTATSSSLAADSIIQQEQSFFASEAEHGGAIGDRKVQEVIIRSTINTNIFRVIKFVSDDDLVYGSRFSQVCLHFMAKDIGDKKYWKDYKKFFGRALNTKRSTSSVAIKSAFMSK